VEQRIFRTPDAGRYVGLATSTLEKMRTAGTGPKYVKVGPRIVGYTKDALDQWLSERTRTSTADRGA
jgi:predicted DNA-binding transcriptional regulator AlpA